MTLLQMRFLCGSTSLGCESLNDGIDMQASDVDCGKASRRLCKNHGKIGAGQQDRLDPVALRKLACNAAQGGGIYRVCFLCIENTLIDIGDKGHFIRPRLDDLHLRGSTLEQTPEAAFHR